MGHFKLLFSDWFNAASAVLLLIAMIFWTASYIFHKSLAVPPALSLIVVFGALVAVLMRLWLTGGPFEAAFRTALKDRCDEVILGWETLAENYLNAPKAEGGSATLPNPMDPAWVSYGLKDWKYQVGVLQGMTLALQRDFQLTAIPTESLTERMGMSELVHAIRRWKDRVRA